MTESSLPVRVLITAIGGGGHGEQVLKALRLAPENRYKLYGADANPRCPQFDLVEKSFVLPMASDPDYLNQLLEICKTHDIKALFHGCEPELKVWSENRDVLERAGLFVPLNPKEVIDTCMDKIRLSETLAQFGLDPPRYMEIHAPEDISKVDFFPVVVKPSTGSGGSANCYIAQNMTELSGLVSFLDLESSSQQFLVQEYVGQPVDEYTVGVLSDMDGCYINSIAVKRTLDSQLNVRTRVPNRTGNDKFGNVLAVSTGVSQGLVGKFPEVTLQCRKIAESLGSRGPLNIQCRFVEGKVRVFEINPRFSGTTSIRALMGFNEPDILIRKHLLGEDITEDFEFREGWVLRSLEEKLLTI